MVTVKYESIKITQLLVFKMAFAEYIPNQLR